MLSAIMGAAGGGGYSASSGASQTDTTNQSAAGGNINFGNYGATGNNQTMMVAIVAVAVLVFFLKRK